MVTKIIGSIVAFFCGILLAASITPAMADWAGGSDALRIINMYFGSNLSASTTRPTFKGFGAASSVRFANGTSAFSVDTGTAATSAIITFPAASNGWACHGEITSGVAANLAVASIASGVNQVHTYYYNTSTGAVSSVTPHAYIDYQCSGM